MTLFVLEGASRSGKSTVRDRLLDWHPEWVVWKGENLMRRGVGQSWVDYRERYHEALHRLYELNPENVIVADRGFTDCVYNSDSQMREEFRRLASCYGDAYIIYFYPGGYDEKHDTAGESVLRARNTRDASKLGGILRRYTKLLSMFEYTHINTNTHDKQSATDAAERYIEAVHERSTHDPDV